MIVERWRTSCALSRTSWWTQRTRSVEVPTTLRKTCQTSKWGGWHCRVVSLFTFLVNKVLEQGQRGLSQAHLKLRRPASCEKCLDSAQHTTLPAHVISLDPQLFKSRLQHLFSAHSSSGLCLVLARHRHSWHSVIDAVLLSHVLQRQYSGRKELLCPYHTPPLRSSHTPRLGGY